MKHAIPARLVLAFAVAALLLCVAAADVTACPNCREALPNGKQVEGQPPEARVAQGFAWSIYLMLAVPFTLAATLGGAAFILIRKASQQPPR